MVITGAALGLPGTRHVFDDANLERILEGQVFVDSIPVRFRDEMANKSITRLVKGENGASLPFRLTEFSGTLAIDSS